MSDWWTKWAERIALVLASLWTRSRSESGGAVRGDDESQSHPGRSADPSRTDHLTETDASEPR